MGNAIDHPAGNFCWFELATTDQEGAKNFYTQLFGWGYNDVPMDAGTYTMFSLNGADVAAAYTIAPEQQAQGMPANWLPYVTTADADSSVAAAIANGATILMPATDVGEFGRMAVIQDPQGAVIAVWRPGEHTGADAVGIPGSICWNELWTSDMPGASRFYSAIFGWGLKLTDMGMPYTEIHNGSEPIGGMFQMDGPDFEGIPPGWTLYFAVENCDQAADRVVALGGSINTPPTDIPNVGRFAVVNDPQGAVFALIRLNG